MKKILLLGMLLAGAIVFAGKYEDEMTERMKVVEEKVQPDLESGSTDGMLNASYKLTAEWEKELNKVYNLILKKLSVREKASATEPAKPVRTLPLNIFFTFFAPFFMMVVSPIVTCPSPPMHISPLGLLTAHMVVA